MRDTLHNVQHSGQYYQWVWCQWETRFINLQSVISPRVSERHITNNVRRMNAWILIIEKERCQWETHYTQCATIRFYLYWSVNERHITHNVRHSMPAQGSRQYACVNERHITHNVRLVRSILIESCSSSVNERHITHNVRLYWQHQKHYHQQQCQWETHYTQCATWEFPMRWHCPKCVNERHITHNVRPCGLSQNMAGKQGVNERHITHNVRPPQVPLASIPDDSCQWETHYTQCATLLKCL